MWTYPFVVPRPGPWFPGTPSRTGRTGLSVITGAGYGVASHALRAAMAGSTGNVAVIAVLACGVDRFYPAGNTDLLQAVAQRGLILLKLAPGVAPTRYRFHGTGSSLLWRGRL